MNFAYLHQVLNNFPNPIWVADTNAKCDFFNKNWLQFTGRDIKDELGDGWVSGVHPDDLQKCVSEFKTAFAARESFSLEYRLKHADGTYHWIFDYGAPHYDEKKNFLGYIGSCYDAQDIKSQLDIISKQNEELEKMNNFMVDREIRIKELKDKLGEK